METKRVIYLLPTDLIDAVKDAADSESRRLGRKVYPAAMVREILRRHLPHKAKAEPRMRALAAR